ncbi:o-succinylbenzoate--CoA ligase [Bacillus sp. DNRA2]|nr:o-succinylbenzoate--CoA ligase [Bacillus sp. DNRA2]NMD72126.1 o-succinylbenzoate--CoA ligase [Bacillus sp. DNRA2]
MSLPQQIPNWLKKRAFLTPERPALIFENETLTFQDTYNRAIDMSKKLAAISIKHGDFVGVLLRNHYDTVIIFYALQMLGATAVILNNRLTGEELAWQLEDSKCTSLISEDQFSTTLDLLNAKQPSYQIWTKQQLLSLEQPNIETDLREEFILDEVCSIMYTSGTTGFPKGVIQTYGNHWWSAIGSVLNLGLTDKDIWLCNMPLFHISGYSILIRSVVYGMPILLHDGFNERKVIDDIRTYQVTIMSVVAASLSRIVKELGSERLSEQFRCMLLGGGPASLSLLDSCKNSGIPVFQTYGMTETASQIVTLSPVDSIRKLGSAGKPLFPAQLKIVNRDGLELSANEEGEIVVKGPNVTPGYLYRETETAEKICDSWLHTGDIGYVDEEGFLYVLDRRADLIISGGENIYPAEIEGVLLSHEAIAEAGVVGVDDEKWGQVPVAFVVREAGKAVTEAELLAYCQQKIANYKIPKKIMFTDSLPRNASNKLMRRSLREQLERGDDEV